MFRVVRVFRVRLFYLIHSNYKSQKNSRRVSKMFNPSRHVKASWHVRNSVISILLIFLMRITVCWNWIISNASSRSHKNIVPIFYGILLRRPQKTYRLRPENRRFSILPLRLPAPTLWGSNCLFRLFPTTSALARARKTSSSGGIYIHTYITMRRLTAATWCYGLWRNRVT